MATRASNVTGLITILVFAGLIAYLLLKKIPEEEPIIKDARSIQGIDVPFGYIHKNRSGFDPRLIELSVYEKAKIPKATRFTYPMGADNGAFTYNAQKFWSDNLVRGGRHTGDDLNGIGGMNSDYGDAIYSVANGRVVFTGVPSPGWGKTVIVAHRLEDGEILQSMYAHLKSIHVRSGQNVERGKKIGEVGTADGKYLAHLHFEMRTSTGIDLGAGYNNTKLNRLDPEETLKKRVGGAEEQIHPSVLEEALRIRDDAWEDITIESGQVVPSTKE